ncbi:hypothetical protein H2200_010325 [Cladophialophora chaetospira]|uniref:Uncharacterized protein n=1 Tax=Cladophialophora chaetospira TaxID=386627 RepID=A0AA38X186_9EURO|nr:hypothetical protein H2200_010325 [Cladophialophora chaetospira]
MTLHVIRSSSTGTEAVTLLVLGAGWTFQFLKPLLDKHASITYAATTSTGHDDTIEFRFNPDSDDLEPFKKLPLADYVLVTFPLKGRGPSRKIVSMYEKTHPSSSSEDTGGSTDPKAKWIQLGSTGVYTAPDWVDNSSPIDPANERGIAEDELLSLGGCVLNLAGLYGAQRQPGNWISRVAKSKEQLGEKGALHLVHGYDVAKAIIGVVEQDKKTQRPAETNPSSFSAPSVTLFGKRWIICDCVSYDWWQLVWDLSGETNEAIVWDDQNTGTDMAKKREYRGWVLDLMEEKGVRALPRSMDAMGRKLDGREFWNVVGLRPERTLKR